MPLIEAALLHSVWGEFRRAIDPGLTRALSALQPLVDEQPVGIPLVRSPVFVSISERTEETFTLVARGNFDLFDNVLTQAAFDLQLVCGRNLVLTSLVTPPLDVRQWRVAAGQVTIGKAGVWHATQGLVRTDDLAADGTSHIISWGGRGRLELEKLGFSVDLLLISDGHGFVGELSLELPVMLPLGSTPLGLNGLAGLLAIHFAPRLLDGAGREVMRPDARDYVRWALAVRADSGLSHWRPARTEPESSAFGLGLNIGTLVASGKVIRIRNAGMALILPQGVLVFGGSGILIDTWSLRFHAVMVYDAESASLALGGHADFRYPDHEPLLTINGPSDGFFPFRHPELFYFNVGTRAAPVQASFNLGLLTSLVSATAFFEIDARRVAFGARITATGGISLPLRLAEAVLVGTVAVETIMGWNPAQIEMLASVGIEMRVSVLLGLVRFSLSLGATVLAHCPSPSLFRVSVEARLEMTGLPPLVAPLTLELLHEDRSTPPVLHGPLLCGFEVDASGTSHAVVGGAAAFLPASGRGWVVLADSADATQAARPIWPDAVLAIPFGERPVDATGFISGAPPALLVRGGYQVVHRLTALNLVADAAPGVPMPGMCAVWAEGPAGTTGRLLVLGDDPFAAVAGRFDRVAPIGRDSAFIWQDFGLGATENVRPTERRAWNDLHVVFPLGGQVWDTLMPSPPTRVLRGGALSLRWSDATGRLEAVTSVRVDSVILSIVDDEVTLPRGFRIAGHLRAATTLETPHSVQISRGALLEGGLRLWVVTVRFSTPVVQVDLVATGNRAALLVASIGWLAVRDATPSRPRPAVLAPGRYTLTMAGTTHATAPPVVDPLPPLPAPVPVPWGVTFGFEVIEPDTLSDYVLEWSVGDGRAPGGRETADWNPTPRRTGFAWYSRYPIALRPRVPWLLELWPGAALELRVVGDSQLGEWVPMRQRSLATTEQTHDMRGRAWILANGGALPHDVEWRAEPAALAAAADGHGAVDQAITVEVRRVRAGSAPLTLHSWPARQSRFIDFAEHVRPADGAVSSGFGPARSVLVDSGRWNDGDPIELTRDGAPPPGWLAPAAVQACAGPIDATAPLRFMQLAHLGSAAASPAQPIDGDLLVPVPATRVAALLDSADRVVALWWRTPEPLDWRRVEASIRVRQLDGSPYGIHFDAAIGVVPSPDGSAAFLVAKRRSDGGVVYMARGTVQLSFLFHMERPGIVPLALDSLLGEWVSVEFELQLGMALGQRP